MKFNLQKVLDNIELEQYAEDIEQRRRDKKIYREQLKFYRYW